MAPDIAEALVRTIELKDGSTAAHTWRVALYAREMARAAGLDTPTTARLVIAASLHDMGKIDVPDQILRKPGPLTPDEFRVMQRHPALGHERLVRMGETDPLLLAVVRHHHERVDGTGYPDRLAGEQIPEVARYFAVIDSFDAMTSARPYRPVLPPDAAAAAMAELRAGIGTRYCAEAVDLFAVLYDAGRVERIMHAFDDANAAPWTARHIDFPFADDL